MRDPSFLIILGTVFVIADIAILSIVFSGKSKKKQKEMARACAQVLGLHYEEGGRAGLRGDRISEEAMAKVPTFLRGLVERALPWRISGQRGGAEIALWVETRSSGKSSSVWTVARAFYAHEPGFGFRIGREGSFTKLGKALFHIQDVEMGDPDFDPLVRVKAADPLRIKTLLDAGSRGAMLRLLSMEPGAWAKEDGVHWERQGVHLDSARLGPILDAMGEVAKGLGRG